MHKISCHKQTHRYRWNTNSDRVENDVEESKETGDPERENQQDDQPNDEPKSFNHFELQTMKSFYYSWPTRF